jgi:hypothetical protein
MMRADREAMAAAIEIMQADPELRGLLEPVPDHQRGLFAVGLLQTRSLRLRPWEAPPCDTRSGDPAALYGSRPGEVELLRRMTAAGVSRYHPSPLQALAAIERAA